MKKRNDLQSAEQIPKLLKLIIYTVSLVSSKITTNLLGYIFSRPLRHKPHIREKEFISSSKKEIHFIPSINKRIKTYELKGSHKKVLLVHGWSGRGSQLSSIATECNKKGFYVVSFDAPAHGGSPSYTTNVPEFVEAINFLNTVKGPFDYAVGHSFGGASIFNYCRKYRVFEKIVVIGTQSKLSTYFKEFIKIMGLNIDYSKKIMTLFEKRVGEKILDYDPERFVRSITSKTLIIHCSDDNYVNFSSAVALRKELKNSELYKTTGLGHRKILGDKKAVNRLVEFLIKN
ncbi:alpha/beta hydrolase [Bacteroidota bacterium]|nr:alpha/beta hydrolase [Bacteroidota bacterium]